MSQLHELTLKTRALRAQLSAAKEEIERLKDDLSECRNTLTVSRQQASEAADHAEHFADRAEKAESELSSLRERCAGLEKCAEFVKWAMQEGSWQGCDLDGGSIQDKALELGLIVKTTYDPEKHGEPSAAYDFADVEPGDDWFVFSPALTQEMERG